MAEEFNEQKQKEVDSKFESFKKDDFSEEDKETVLNNADDILNKASKGALSKFFEDIQLLIELVKAYFKGEYKEIPVRTLSSIVLTLVYVFSPIDIIPDLIPVVGLMDDAAMVGLCLKFVHDDLQDFKKWRDSKLKIEKK